MFDVNFEAIFLLPLLLVVVMDVVNVCPQIVFVFGSEGAFRTLETTIRFMHILHVNHQLFRISAHKIALTAQLHVQIMPSLDVTLDARIGLGSKIAHMAMEGHRRRTFATQVNVIFVFG